METRHIVAAVMLVSLLNGMFSPAVVFSWGLMPYLFPILAATGPAFVIMTGSLALAVTTLVVSGVPAALYERVTGTRATPTSAWIWLGSALILSLPMILGMATMLTRP
jgi:sorbitol-specific phosphotransferase system component IIBC